ncbi:phosphatase PAP2 family protein [Yinghuangia sp. ASG 101]|uniref:phosphatase PAP2 family protein n=1 Tax=Yinghuangia sp. ASG 101 TaxID=2896848 RepID=UPI001E61DD2A|nr:phosphatase PAP2 family protein [Yinghuangia sp. ASG 101]UGQ15211.1 phosphatase PAP2 family protein [Yinghuangia sp. ASG 101]
MHTHSTRPSHRFGYAYFALLAAAVFGALLLMVVSGWDMLFEIDVRVARDLHGWARENPGATQALRILTNWVWDPVTFRVLAAGLAAFLWLRGERRKAVWVVTVMTVGALAGVLCKTAVARERPMFVDPVDTAHGWSFPSGHALNGVLGCGVLLIGLWPLIPRRVRPFAVLAAVVSALGVGFTRLALGVHYLSDVVAGWALGVVVLAVFWAVVAVLWESAEAEITPEIDRRIDADRSELRVPG